MVNIFRKLINYIVIIVSGYRDISDYYCQNINFLRPILFCSIQITIIILKIDFCFIL